MTRGVAVLIGACGLGLLAPLPARAARVGLTVEATPCASPGVDLDALAERIRIELTTRGEGIEVGPAADGDAVAVHVREGCPDTRIVVTFPEREVSIERTVELGEPRGAARRWALALLIVDLIRTPPPAVDVTTAAPVEARGNALAEPTPNATVDASAPEPSRPERPPPEPDPPPPEPERGHIDLTTTLRLQLQSRTYLLTTTPLVGASLGVAHAWFRIDATGLGTEMGADNGNLALGAFLLDIAVRPLVHREPSWRLALELVVCGGAGYADARPDRGVAAVGGEVWFPLFGGAVAGRLDWIIDPQFALTLDARVGFDLLGSELLLGSVPVATTWGPWIGVGLGGTLPL